MNEADRDGKYDETHKFLIERFNYHEDFSRTPKPFIVLIGTLQRKTSFSGGYKI
jgi:hypothetical protein